MEESLASVTLRVKQRSLLIKTATNPYESEVWLKSRNGERFLGSIDWTKINHILGQMLKGEKSARISFTINPEAAKLSGIDWIAMRMLEGAMPIVLRAPSISRTGLIHIEKSHENPNEFHMRLVDPDSENRTEPQTLNQVEVEQLQRTFPRAGY